MTWRLSPLLDVRDLQVHFAVYGGLLKVLDGINIAVGSGEKVGLVGETGCGKTTTMKAILRVLPMPPARIDGGEIFFEGRDILKMKSAELHQVRGRGISMIFQDPTAALNPVFSIGQQLDLVIAHAAAVRGETLSRKELRQRAMASLQEVALADPERLAAKLPHSAERRHAPARVHRHGLGYGPCLADRRRAGTSLDVTIQDQILRLLQALVKNKNTSVILITHTLGIVRELTDRVYVMYAGNIVETAGTAELFDKTVSPIHAGPIADGSEADGRRHRKRHSRPNPRLSQSAAGLSVPYALPARDGHLPQSKSRPLSRSTMAMRRHVFSTPIGKGVDRHHERRNPVCRRSEEILHRRPHEVAQSQPDLRQGGRRRFLLPARRGNAGSGGRVGVRQKHRRLYHRRHVPAHVRQPDVSRQGSVRRKRQAAARDCARKSRSSFKTRARR